MGVAFQLRDEFSGTAMQIKKSMEDLDQYTITMARKVDSAMTQIRGGFAMVAVGAAILAPSLIALNKAGDYEQLGIALETMLKSRSRAQQMMKDIDAFAASTPFEIAPLREASKKLLAYTVEAEDLIPTLRMLGDIAAGVGTEKMPQLILAFGQIKAAGRLMGTELRQLRETGLNILPELAKLTGYSAEKISQDVGTLNIPFETVQQAMMNMTQEGGLFNNLMAKQAKSMHGMWSNAMDQLSLSMQSWGTQLLPLAKRVIGWFSGILSAFRKFAESPVGSFILKLVTALGALLVVGGLLLILVGGMRFAVYRMAGAFGDLTKATILQTIAQRGMIAGLRAMGRAAWASLGPYALIAVALLLIYKGVQKLRQMMNSANPIIMAFGAAILFAMGPIGWFIGLVTLAQRALREFDAVGANGEGLKGGFIGVLQKVGGIIRGVMELWRSWDEQTQTFSLSENMYKKLQSMGILQTVLNIGTYIARIKAFLKGVKEGFMEVIRMFKGAVMAIWNALQPAEEKFTKWETLVGKARGSMEKYRDVGKKVGMVLAIAFIGLILLMVSLGLVTLAVFVLMAVAMALVLAPFILIGYIVYKVYQAFQWLHMKIEELRIAFIVWVSVTAAKMWGLWQSIKDGASSMVSSVTGAFSSMWNTVIGWGQGLIDWFTALPGRIYDAGSNMVTSLWEGMKSQWGAFVNWLKTALSSLPGLGQLLGLPSLGGGAAPAGAKGSMTGVGPDRGTMIGRLATSAAQRIAPAPQQAQMQMMPVGGRGPTTRNIKVMLGTRELGQFVDDESSDEYARNNGEF